MTERTSTLKRDVLKKYPNDTFIETGTYDGSGCLVAIEAGFKRVISIEIAPRLYEFSKERLKLYPEVELHLGDSSDILPDILSGLQCPATFWIDSHQPQDGVAHKSSWLVTPVLLEIDAIRKHPIKNHTILIDDLDLCGTEHMDFVAEDIIKFRLRLINPDYRFAYEDGNKPGSVLVALP